MAIGASGAVVLPLVASGSRSAPQWAPGPFPFKYAIAGSPGRESHSGEATAEARGTYFSARITRVLHTELYRQHRGADATLGTAKAFAVELLTHPSLEVTGVGAIGIIHLKLSSDDPGADLAPLVRVDGSMPTELRKSIVALFPGWKLRAEDRAMHIAFNCRPTSVKATSSAGRWSQDDSDLFRLAAAATPRFSPDTRDPELPGQIVHMSVSWKCVVLRNGIGFLAQDPQDSTDIETLRSYAHSLYLDVVLLAQLQRLSLRYLADEAAAVGSEANDDRLLVRARTLQEKYVRFRSMIWWEDLSNAGRANEMLNALQRQAGLKGTLDEVQHNVSVLTSFARTLRAESEAASDARTNLLLTILTLIGLPSGLVFAVAALGFDASVPLLVVSILIALVLSGLLILATQVGRDAIKLFTRRT